MIRRLFGASKPSPEEKAAALAYLSSLGELIRRQDVLAERHNGVLTRVGNSYEYDSQALEAARSASESLAHEATQIRTEHAQFQIRADIAVPAYLAWQTAWLDYEAWARGIAEFFVGIEAGYAPNALRLLEVSTNRDRSHEQALQEEATLVRRLGLAPTELANLLSPMRAPQRRDDAQPQSASGSIRRHPSTPGAPSQDLRPTPDLIGFSFGATGGKFHCLSCIDRGHWKENQRAIAVVQLRDPMSRPIAARALRVVMVGRFGSRRYRVDDPEIPFAVRDAAEIVAIRNDLLLVPSRPIVIGEKNLRCVDCGADFRD